MRPNVFIRLIALALIPVLLQQQVLSAQGSVVSARQPVHCSLSTDRFFTSEVLMPRSAMRVPRLAHWLVLSVLALPGTYALAQIISPQAPRPADADSARELSAVERLFGLPNGNEFDLKRTWKVNKQGLVILTRIELYDPGAKRVWIKKPHNMPPVSRDNAAQTGPNITLEEHVSRDSILRFFDEVLQMEISPNGNLVPTLLYPKHLRSENLPPAGGSGLAGIGADSFYTPPPSKGDIVTARGLVDFDAQTPAGDVVSNEYIPQANLLVTVHTNFIDVYHVDLDREQKGPPRLLKRYANERYTHFSGIRASAFSPDRTQLALALGNGTLLVLTVEAGRSEPLQLVYKWEAPNGPLDRLTFSPDGRDLFAARATDRQALRWRLMADEKTLTRSRRDSPPIAAVQGASDQPPYPSSEEARTMYYTLQKRGYNAKIIFQIAGLPAKTVLEKMLDDGASREKLVNGCKLLLQYEKDLPGLLTTYVVDKKYLEELEISALRGIITVQTLQRDFPDYCRRQQSISPFNAFYWILFAWPEERLREDRARFLVNGKTAESSTRLKTQDRVTLEWTGSPDEPQPRAVDPSRTAHVAAEFPLWLRTKLTPEELQVLESLGFCEENGL